MRGTSSARNRGRTCVTSTTGSASTSNRTRRTRNHVFFLGDEPWSPGSSSAMRYSLADPRRRIAIDVERVHDGVVHDGRVYFTTVNGCVAVADAETLELVDVIQLATLAGPESIAGWCRGLYFNGDDLWVGFSRIRATRFRQAVSWVRTGLARSCPTRIAQYRLSDWACLAEINLEPFGLHAVFTIVQKGQSHEQARFSSPATRSSDADGRHCDRRSDVRYRRHRAGAGGRGCATACVALPVLTAVADKSSYQVGDVAVVTVTLQNAANLAGYEALATANATAAHIEAVDSPAALTAPRARSTTCRSRMLMVTRSSPRIGAGTRRAPPSRPG